MKELSRKQRVKRIKRNSQQTHFLTKISLDTKRIITSLSEMQFASENRQKVVSAMNASCCCTEFMQGFRKKVSYWLCSSQIFLAIRM